MRTGPKKRIFRRRRRLGVFLYLPLSLLIIVGGFLVLGFDFVGGAGTRHVTEVKSPVLAKAPQAMSGKARDASKAKEKAAEQKKADEQKKAKEAKKKAEEKKKAEAAAKKKADEQKKAAAKKADEQKAAAKKKKAAAQAMPPTPVDNTLYLTVPKMGRYSDVVYNTNSDAAMNYGAVKLPSTAFPWQNNGNTYIAAHVLGYSGTGSLYQFANLPNMTYGDKIYLTDTNGYTYEYEVSEIFVVTPYDSWVTDPVAGRNMVTLQTCIDPPAYDQRLIVRGDRVAIIPPSG